LTRPVTVSNLVKVTVEKDVGTAVVELMTGVPVGAATKTVTTEVTVTVAFWTEGVTAVESGGTIADVALEKTTTGVVRRWGGFKCEVGAAATAVVDVLV